MNSGHCRTNVCRICGRLDAPIYINLLSEEHVSLKKMLVDLFAGIGFDNENLPAGICHICTSVTTDFYRVWKTYPDIQEKLAASFKSTDTVHSSKPEYKNEDTRGIRRKTSANRNHSPYPVIIPTPNRQDKSKCSENGNDYKPVSSHPSFSVTPSTSSRIRKHVNSDLSVTTAVATSTSDSKKRNNEKRELCITILKKDNNDFTVKKHKKFRKHSLPCRTDLSRPKTSESPSSISVKKKNDITISETNAVNTNNVPASSEVGQKSDLRRQNKESDHWYVHQIPGKSYKLYRCLKCNSLLLNEAVKRTHVCNKLPQVSFSAVDQKRVIFATTKEMNAYTKKC